MGREEAYQCLLKIKEELINGNYDIQFTSLEFECLENYFNQLQTTSEETIEAFGNIYNKHIDLCELAYGVNIMSEDDKNNFNIVEKVIMIKKEETK